jgi:hypothetical protein
MLWLKNFRFEIYTEGPKSADMFVIKGEQEEGAPGFRYLWFVLTRAEIEDLVRGKTSTAEDGYHKLFVSGDAWTFYNFEYPRGKAGEVVSKFYRLDMPRFFVKLVLRIAKRVWDAQRAEWERSNKDRETYRGDRFELRFTRPQLEHFDRLYGQGKGRIEVVYQDRYGAKPGTAASKIADLAELTKDLPFEKSFAKRFENVKQIALNSTRGHHETARVTISNDSSRADDWTDGYYWTAQDSRGRRIMNGGIINHSREGGHDWSIHT